MDDETEADVRYVPDQMTPAWSHQLALACQSPMWQSLHGMEQRDVFVEAAAKVATYDDLPPRLKALYQEAMRQLREPGRELGDEQEQ